MIVIKATLREETRRITFDSHGFPPYEEVQDKLRGIFSLPSSAHPFWVNCLFFPDDAQPSRIKFKQHVCDKTEYELAQQPFLRVSGFPNPVLVFTVLLSSDARMSTIHDFHRAIAMQAEARELENHIRILEDDLVKRHQILVMLEDKLDFARRQDDAGGMSFWSDRVEEKRHGLPELEEKLRGVRADRRALVEELERIRPTSNDLSLRQWSDSQEIDAINRMHETESELAAWQIENSENNDANLFPPLESVLRGAPQHRRPPWHAHAHPPHPWGQGFAAAHWAQPAPPPGFPRPAPPANTTGPGAGANPRPLRDILSSADLTGTAAREMGTLLDRFLNHFQGQLADTLDGFAARIAPHPSEVLDTNTHEAAAAAAAAAGPEPRIPGAFVQPEAQPAADAHVQKEKTPKPSSKLGKGGFRHKHITCDGCLTGIRGTRYKCDQCNDYDLCGTCLPLLHTDALHPPSHTFKAMVHPGLEERIKFGGTTSSRSPHQTSRHPATCDICSEVIVGVRWKCLNCPDWDCCSACSKLVPNVHPDHSFVKLHKPTDYVVNAAWDAKNDVHHPFVVCDGCNLTIRGPRFKCMHPDCPDYDLCVKCEAAPVPVHPESHPMLKTKTPLRINAKSSFDPIKNVYEDHCRYRVSRDSARKPKAKAPTGATRVPAVPTAAPAKPSASFGSSSSVNKSAGSEKTPAFSRGEEYAKAVDALLSSMSTMKIAGSGSKAASVSTEKEEAALMEGGQAPALTEAAATPTERMSTPKPVGAFPHSEKGSPRGIPLSAEEKAIALGYPLSEEQNNIALGKAAPRGVPLTEEQKQIALGFYTPQNLLPPAPKEEEKPLMQLDSPVIAATPKSSSPEIPALPGCVLPRLPREFDLNAEAQEPEMAKEIEAKFNEIKAAVESENIEYEVVKEERADPISAIIAAAQPVEAAVPTQVNQYPIIADIAAAAPKEPVVSKEPVAPNDIVTWVRHSTILPGTTLPAGAEFTKTWRVHHFASGSEFDFEELRLVHKSEGLLGDGCKASVVFTRDDIVKGEDKEVILSGLKVPHLPGREIIEQWRFEDEKGVAYGQPLRVRIAVEETHSNSSDSASSSFIVPNPTGGDSFYNSTEYNTPAPPSVQEADEIEERLSSVASTAPSTVDVVDAEEGDDASSTFSFSDVEHVTHTTRTASSDDLGGEYDFVDETDEETEDGF